VKVRYGIGLVLGLGLAIGGPRYSGHKPEIITFIRRWLQLRFEFASTAVILTFDCNSTALRPLDHLHYDCCCIDARVNKQVSVTVARRYVTVTLMTFDKQSNGRRIEVES